MGDFTSHFSPDDICLNLAVASFLLVSPRFPPLSLASPRFPSLLLLYPRISQGAHMAAAQLFSGEPSKVTYSNIRTSYAMPGQAPPLPSGMPPGGAAGGIYGGAMGVGYGGLGMGMVPMFYPSMQQQTPLPQSSSTQSYGQSFDSGLGFNYDSGPGSRGGRGGRGGRGERRDTGSSLGAMGMSSSLGFDSLGAGSQQGYSLPSSSGGGVYGPGGATASSVMEQISPPLYSSVDGNLVTMQMGVPDQLVGSVLGKAGSTVKEIMVVSGANIQISQKDNYLPGTSHRSIVVKGSQSQVQTALSIIMIKLHG